MPPTPSRHNDQSYVILNIFNIFIVIISLLLFFLQDNNNNNNNVGDQKESEGLMNIAVDEVSGELDTDGELLVNLAATQSSNNIEVIVLHH